MCGVYAKVFVRNNFDVRMYVVYVVRVRVRVCACTCMHVYMCMYVCDVGAYAYECMRDLCIRACVYMCVRA